MTDTMNEHIKRQLEEHKFEVKTKIDERKITKKQHRDKIIEVLNRASTTIGIAPITNESIMKEIKIGEKNNKISEGNNFNEKKEIVIKHMVRQWTKNNLDISD